MEYEFIIGIDTGVNTGIAIWNCETQEFENIYSTMIHKAIISLLEMKEYDIFVRVEDARIRTWFGNSGREKLQGAGSVKRDAKIMEDFLTDMEIPFELVAPKNNKTKLDSATFKKITGWKRATNQHGRDAATLAYQFKPLI